MGLLNNMLPNLLGGISSVATSLINRKTDMQNQIRQNEMNMRMSELEYKRQKEMFNEANIYNSPREQMKRYTDAGLNPNLIYGQGTPGNAPNVLPQYRAPEQTATRKEPINPVDVLQTAMSYKIQAQQLENLKADRRAKELANEYNSYRNFYGADLWRNKQASGFLANWFKEKERDQAMGVYDEGSHITPEYQAFLNSKWALPGKQLANYNSQIALANARKDLLDLDISWYTPRWATPAMGLIGNLLKPGSMFRSSKTFSPNKGTSTKPFSSKVPPNFKF